MKESKKSTRKEYKFNAFGHPNILATHVKTIELTKDSELTKRGDCIIGVKSTFNKEKLKEFNGKVKVTFEVDGLKKIVKCKVNPNYDSDEEMVFRKSFFNSPRTFGFNLNHGANRVDRKIIEKLKNPSSTMIITIEEGWY